MKLLDTIAIQLRIIYALMVREAKMRTKDSPIGILSIIMEPLAFILLMTAIFYYVRMRSVALGDYLMLFFMTGLLPLYFFKGGLNGLRTGLLRHRQIMYANHVRPLDIFMTTMAFYFFSYVALFFLIHYFFVFVYGYEGAKYLILCLDPMIGNACIGIGFGVVVAVVAQFFKYITVITATIFGPINIVSGMFYTAQTAPPIALPYLYYNPLFHSTELMREYYYYDYTSPIFDPYYYYGWVIASLAVGLSVERLLRHRLLAAAG